MADSQQLTSAVGNGRRRSTERSPESGLSHGGADDSEGRTTPPSDGGPANNQVATEVATWTPEGGAGGGVVEQTVKDGNGEVVSSPTVPTAVASVDSKCSGSGPAGKQSQQRKKRHRRGKSKRQRKLKRWKPYNERTWEEKRQVDEREARRALRREAERFAHGQPVAPYNTTQFLMEDHRSANDEAGAVPELQQATACYRHCSSSDDGDEADADMDFLQRQDFCEVYDSLHAERLGSMSKHQLIQEYLYLEDRVEKLQNALGTPQRQSGRLWSGLLTEAAAGPPGEEEEEVVVPDIDVAKVVTMLPAPNQQWNAENLAKVRIFQSEIRKLVAENGKLRRENDLLRTSRRPHDITSPDATTSPRSRLRASDSDNDTGGGGDGHLVGAGELRDAADA